MAGNHVQLRIRLAGLFLVLAGAALVAGQQSPQTTTPSQSSPATTDQSPTTPTFKAQVEYVEVDALVTDQTGQFVRGLTKDDFQVFEDGKRQTITNFSTVDIPIERADRPLFSPTVIEPDVRSNERPFDGRVYVLILDDLHVAPLRSQQVRIAARQFIQRNLGANDLMAVVFTGGRSQDAQEFTSSKRLLLAAVDKFMGRNLSPVTISRNNEYFRVRDIDPGRISDPDEQERAYNARSTLSAMKQVAEWFGGVRGRRKSMLLISEGINYDLTDIIREPSAPASAASGLLYDIQETITATARSNVSIYAIDPRGLSGLSDESIEVAQFANMEDRTTGIGQSSLESDLRVSQDSLRSLAGDTGGFAAINRNDFTSAFARIVADNSSYYVLAYYPPSDKRDGKFHKIEVKVNRPGLTVRSRRGYSSPRGKPAPQNTKTGGLSPELFEAINSPIQVSGLTVRAFAAPFKGTAPNSSVLIGMELLGRDLTLEGNSRVEVTVMAVDSKAKVFGPRTSAMTLNLRPDTRERVAESGVRVLNRMELPPGRYQLRLAARDTSKASVGTIVYDLDVPDFYKDPIGMSGITITSLASAGMLTPQADEQLKGVLPAPPVSARSFAQNDELAIFAEVYDNSGGAPHKVDVVASIITDEGRVLFKAEETYDSAELQGGKGGYGYTARIPLSDIAPGPYVLKVEARSRLGRDTAVARQVQFRIDPAAR